MVSSFIELDPGTKLVGRALEQTNMQQVLDSALAGSAGALAVLGEPGIGKTRMLGELCKRAAAAGFDVLVGRGSEFEREVPYGLVVEALDERFGVLEAEVIEDMGPDRLAELAAVLPSLSGRGGRFASLLEVERFEFYRAVRSTFERVVRGRPLLLALDDVHWADPASVELISHLLRRSVPGMVLALAYRPKQAPGALLGAVEQATREGFFHELELAPLTVVEAADLLGQRPGSELLRSLHAESGGNPFYLEQLARMARLDSAAPRQEAWVERDRETDISATLRVTLDSELAVLPAGTVTVLQAAAVAGDPFDVDLVAEVAATDTILVSEYLDALATADVIRGTDVAGTFRFRHPIVRRVVYNGTLPGWRFGAHKRAARALARRGASLGVQAHHVARSASVGDEQAVAVLTEAGQAAVARAPAAAADWFDAALRLLPETGEFDRRLSLVISLASALASSGNLRDSRTVLERALEFLPVDALDDRVRIIRMIVRVDHGLGHAEEARRLIVRALEHAATSSADAIALRLELAQNHLMMHQWEQAVDTTAQARAQAQTLSDPSLLLAATATLAWFTSYQGAFGEAQELIELAAEGIDARDVNLTPEMLEGLADLVFAELFTDRFRAAARHAQLGLRVSRSTGHGYAFSRFAIGAAASKLFLGQLHDAKRAAETAIEATLLLDNDQLLSTAQTAQCWVEAMRGDLSAALTAGRAAVRIVDRLPDTFFGWLARACYGEALIEAGETERGCEAILSAGGSGFADLPPGNAMYWHQALITAELSAGRVEAAQSIAQRMENIALLPSREGNASFARARIHLAKGDFMTAAAFAQKAVQCFDSVEMCVWSARSRLLAGRSLGQANRSEAAIRELELAHGTFADAGAERLRDEAAQVLRTMGRRVRRQTTVDEPTDSANLTDRERSIAARVVQGYTNREIAAELFVSPKTVEKHIARIFAKLGISSRAGVANALSRHRRGPPGRTRL
ncbi:helix-turn-helix transcriptional regulator [Nocardia amamiensis]|uniref:helix-turn-helix transcriptional regulator n=1 Tax=Nocardia amamiensis TaxID=404578 RepID=UPI0008344C0F|nr:LuxR family transcriptional regulator [Nocardia amamiensis]